MAGFTTAVEDAGGRLSKQLLLKDVPGFYTGFYGTEQLLAGNRDIEVIYFQNDNMAIGGLNYCKRIGLDMPQDIGIAGWGDLPITAIQPFRLTSTAVSHLKIGQLASEMVLRRISGQSVEATKDVGFSLIQGNTTR